MGSCTCLNLTFASDALVDFANLKNPAITPYPSLHVPPSLPLPKRKSKSPTPSISLCRWLFSTAFLAHDVTTTCVCVCSSLFLISSSSSLTHSPFYFFCPLLLTSLSCVLSILLSLFLSQRLYASSRRKHRIHNEIWKCTSDRS